WTQPPSASARCPAGRLGEQTQVDVPSTLPCLEACLFERRVGSLSAQYIVSTAGTTVDSRTSRPPPTTGAWPRRHAESSARRAICSGVSTSRGNSSSSRSCAVVRALAIGAATVGWARSHASATAAVVVSCSAATSARVFSTLPPRSSWYSTTSPARALSTLPFEYLPVRKPLASA